MCTKVATQSTVPTRHRRQRVSKCGQLSQQTRRLDPMLIQCWSSAVGGGPILKQHWVKCSRLLGSTQVSLYTHPSATITFSPADQGTFSKTAGQSQAYYNTWNWERGKYDVNHLHILTCEGAVSRVSSVKSGLKPYSFHFICLRCTSYRGCGPTHQIPVQCWASVAAHFWFNAGQSSTTLAQH